MKKLQLLLPAYLGCLITGCSASGGTGHLLPSAAFRPDMFGDGKGAIQVTSAADSGNGSLREAVKTAKAGQTITFSLKKHAKITLKTGAIALTKSVTITGPGATLLSISGNGKSQVFTVAARTKVTISGLTITNGSAASGGAIVNAGNLKLISDTFSSNVTKGTPAAAAPRMLRLHFDVRPHTHNGRAGKAPHAPKIPQPNSAVTDAGGAIYNMAVLTVTDSTLTSNNVQKGSGGAIYNAQGATLTVSGSTFQKNEGALGGGVYNAGTATLSDDAFAANKGWPGSGAPISGGFAYGTAVYVDGNTAVSTCKFSGNVAGGVNEGSIGVGGAIAQYSGALNVAHSSFTSNVAGGGNNGSWGTGGAIYTTAGTLVLTDNTFTGNRAGGDAYGYGGAVYADQTFSGSGNTYSANTAFGSAAEGYSYGGAVYAGSGLALSDDSFNGNAASAGASGQAFGGALDSESTSTLTTVTFSGNTANGGSGGSAEGGAVYVDDGTSKWTNVTLSSNKALSSGLGSYSAGGAVAAFAPLTVTGTSAVTGNAAATATAGAVAGQGGAFAIEDGPFIFTGSATGNTATTQGGAFWIDDIATISIAVVSANKVLAVQNPLDGGGGVYVSLRGALTLTRSALTGNSTAGTATDTGGGALFNSANASVTNATIGKNSSSVDGGGIENDGVGTFTLTNVTIYQNAAAKNGGNLKNLFSDATMSFANSIVGGGTALLGPDISNDGTITSGDYNLVQTAVAGTALAGTTTHDLSGDPKLTVLANNGGPTQTNADGTTSPGTAYIPVATCTAAGITVDQRGDHRNPKGLGFCDVGAYENQNP